MKILSGAFLVAFFMVDISLQQMHGRQTQYKSSDEDDDNGSREESPAPDNDQDSTEPAIERHNHHYEDSGYRRGIDDKRVLKNHQQSNKSHANNTNLKKKTNKKKPKIISKTENRTMNHKKLEKNNIILTNITSKNNKTNKTNFFHDSSGEYEYTSDHDEPEEQECIDERDETSCPDNDQDTTVANYQPSIGYPDNDQDTTEGVYHSHYSHEPHHVHHLPDNDQDSTVTHYDRGSAEREYGYLKHHQERQRYNNHLLYHPNHYHSECVSPECGQYHKSIVPKDVQISTPTKREEYWGQPTDPIYHKVIVPDEKLALFKSNDINENDQKSQYLNSTVVDVNASRRQIQGSFNQPFHYVDQLKRQTWRKPFNFEGSILNRFKEHWKEEEREGKHDKDYESSDAGLRPSLKEQMIERERIKYEEELRFRKEQEKEMALEEKEKEKEKKKKSKKKKDKKKKQKDQKNQQTKDMNATKNDNTESFHQEKIDDNNNKVDYREWDIDRIKKEKDIVEDKLKANEEKAKAAKDLADKIYASLSEPKKDEDEGPDDPPPPPPARKTKSLEGLSKSKPGELHWNVDFSEFAGNSNLTTNSTQRDETSKSIETDLNAKVAELKKQIEIEKAYGSIKGTDEDKKPTSPSTATSTTNKPEDEAKEASAEQAYSSIKPKEVSGSMKHQDAEDPYASLKPTRPIDEEIAHGQVLKDAGDGKGTEEDNLKYDRYKGFRPPNNWYNRLSDEEKHQHEFHEQLLSGGSDRYKNIEKPHDGVEKFGNKHEEIDINDSTHTGDVDVDEVQREIQHHIKELPTHDTDEMDKLNELGENYEGSHHSDKHKKQRHLGRPLEREKPQHYHHDGEENDREEENEKYYNDESNEENEHDDYPDDNGGHYDDDEHSREFKHPKFELENTRNRKPEARTHDDYDDNYNDNDEDYKRGEYHTGEFHGGGEYNDDPVKEIENIENETVFPELTGHVMNSHHKSDNYDEHRDPPEDIPNHHPHRIEHNHEPIENPRPHHERLPEVEEPDYERLHQKEGNEGDKPAESYHHHHLDKPNMIISPESLKDHMREMASDHNPTTNNDIPGAVDPKQSKSLPVLPDYLSMPNSPGYSRVADANNNLPELTSPKLEKDFTGMSNNLQPTNLEKSVANINNNAPPSNPVLNPNQLPNQLPTDPSTIENKLAAGLPDFTGINNVRENAQTGKPSEETKPTSDKAELLLNEMQEIAMRNQKLLDSPESPLNGNTKPRNSPFKDLSAALPDPSQIDPLPSKGATASLLDPSINNQYPSKDLSAALPDPSMVDLPPGKETASNIPNQLMQPRNHQLKNSSASLIDTSMVDPLANPLGNEARLTGKNEIEMSNVNHVYFIKSPKPPAGGKSNHMNNKKTKKVFTDRMENSTRANFRKFDNSTIIPNQKRKIKKSYSKLLHKKNIKSAIKTHPFRNMSVANNKKTKTKNLFVLANDHKHKNHLSSKNFSYSRPFKKQSKFKHFQLNNAKAQRRNTVKELFSNRNTVTIKSFYHPKQLSHKDLSERKSTNENRKELILHHFFLRQHGKG